MRVQLKTVLAIGLVGLSLRTPLAAGQERVSASQPAPPRVQRPPKVSPDGVAPFLRLSRTLWDFGEQWRGQPTATEITLGNIGGAPLEILRVKSSCGCTIAQPKKRKLLPGEFDTMSLSYDTKRHNRKVSQSITLETNDPRQPTVTIQVKGVVRPLFEAEPSERIIFQRLKRDAVAVKSIELRNNMDEKVFLKLKPTSEPAPFEIELEETEPGMVYKLTATTKPPLSYGVNSVTIELETGLEGFPTLTHMASTYVVPRVTVVPPRLYLTRGVTKPHQRVARVTYHTETPLEIKEIKSSHPDLIRAEVMPPRASTTPKATTLFHELRVHLPAASEFPEGGASLEIYTNDPEPEFQKLVILIRMRPVTTRPANKAPKEALSPRAATEPGLGAADPKPSDTPPQGRFSEPAGETEGGAKTP